MNKQLSYGDELFIAKKQNLIREKALKKQEIRKQINGLLGEIEFLEIDFLDIIGGVQNESNKASKYKGYATRKMVRMA